MFLDVRDLTITLKTGEEIAKDISFSIDGGEMLSIVGSSGAGKTTVLWRRRRTAGARFPWSAGPPAAGRSPSGPDAAAPGTSGRRQIRPLPPPGATVSPPAAPRPRTAVPPRGHTAPHAGCGSAPQSPGHSALRRTSAVRFPAACGPRL